MRTTLAIDDDVLQVARERAKRERRSVGAVVSELARQALTAPSTDVEDDEFFGFAPLRSRGGTVTNDLIDELRDEEG
jgi:hypothetical protein